ncbi:MAG: 50S ribosomal protein L18 [Patescibacteria group bacterium]|nr:50S ribosomal protein L18 [Patescibacteria group bacterium]
MDRQKIKQYQRSKRKGRVRAKVSGTGKCPRLSVFRSNKGMYLQLIDDERGKTLVSARSSEVKKKDKPADSSADAPASAPASAKAMAGEKAMAGKKVAISFELGKLIAKKALAKKIEQVVFDRGGHKYHGRVKAVAEGARTGGLKF